MIPASRSKMELGFPLGQQYPDEELNFGHLIWKGNHALSCFSPGFQSLPNREPYSAIFGQNLCPDFDLLFFGRNDSIPSREGVRSRLAAWRPTYRLLWYFSYARWPSGSSPIRNRDPF